MDTGSSKMSVLYSRTLDLEEDGFAVDISHFDPGMYLAAVFSALNDSNFYILISSFLGSQAVLVYVTMYGTIIGWDLRANGNAWKIKSKTKQGTVILVSYSILLNHDYDSLTHGAPCMKYSVPLTDHLKFSGAVTTMCMDSLQSCIILGTACGYHTCIDLRFRLPITSVVHPYCKLLYIMIRMHILYFI